jgi:tripartite-type tricarboxylate transporter receptor subunit TctC
MPIARSRAKAALFIAALLGLAPKPAVADDFYAGKIVNFIVGTDVAGGFAIYARLIAKHLGRFIPGNPTMVVKTMPGAGGATAAAFLYRRAPADGLTIAALTPNAISGQVMEEGAQSQFDPTKFHYLAGAERGTRLCMTFYTSKIKTFDDALTKPAIIGATSGGSPATEYAAVHKHALGAKFNIVSGYRDPGDIYLAMERGEIDGVCGLDWAATKAQRPDWLRDKKLNLLIQDNIEPDPELSALGVPQPWTYIKDEIDRRAVELMIGFQQAFGKAYVAPPDVPADRIAILRDAFAAALRDKELLADAEQQRIEITPQSGDAVERAVLDLYAAPKAVVARLKQIVVP